jgi:hypothetical protein
MDRLIFRCSELDRTLSCNGSITLAPMVDKRESEEGQEGTLLHAMAAQELVTQHGAVGTVERHTPTLHNRWIAEFYVRHIISTAPPTWGMEVECALEQDFTRFTLTGHIDCIAVSPDATEAIGYDLKTGYNAVDIAEENEQIAGYCVELVAAYPTLRKVTFYIVQPRNDEDDGHPRVSCLTLEGDQLAQVVAGFERRMNAAIDNARELNSGIKQCRFCPVSLQCPALRADLAIMKLQLTDSLAAITRTPNDAQLGDWVCTARTLAPVTKAAEELIHSRLDATECVVAGNGTVITRKMSKGSIEVLDPVKFYQSAKEQLVTDERIARVFRPSKMALIDELAEALDIPKTGANGVTSTSMYDAHYGPLTKQSPRRILQFNG